MSVIWDPPVGMKTWLQQAWEARARRVGKTASAQALRLALTDERARPVPIKIEWYAL